MNNHRKVWLIVCFLCLFGRGGFAAVEEETSAVRPVAVNDQGGEVSQAEVLTLSLAQAREYALRCNAEMQNARLDVVAARRKIWETTASGLPQITAKVSYMDNLQIPTTLIPARFIDPDAAEGDFIGVKFGTQHNASLELTANQLVFSGSYIVALRASKVYLQLSQNQMAKKEVEVREMIADTYHLILLAERNRETVRKTLDNLRSTLAEAREIHDAGFIEATDVDQLQLTVTDMENSLAAVERQIVLGYQMLKFQMGMDLRREVRLGDGLNDIVAAIPAEELLQTPLDTPGHIDFRLLDTQEKSLTLLMKREKTEYLPTVSAYVTHSQSAMRDRFDFFAKGGKWFPGTIVGLQISLPIFNFGMTAARIAQARLEVQKVQNLKRQVTEGLALALNQARAEFRDALARVKNTERNVTLADRIYENARVKFGKGMITSTELTQQHNQYLTAESNHVQALSALLSARVKLEKALNRL